MVIHTSVLYRFHLVFGPPWWWHRRVEACGRKQYVMIRIDENLFQLYFAHFRLQCPHRQELRVWIKLPKHLPLLVSLQICLCSNLDYDGDCFDRFYRAAVHFVQSNSLILLCNRVARGGAVGWGTALQAGSSRLRFPTMSLELFILPAALWPWGTLSL
jgi:hypothetical protein